MAFTLVGRLQYAYDGGTWNEWHALFDNGSDSQRSAWLSEDNGAYVIAFDAGLPADAPVLDTLRAGQRVQADGRAWAVASVVQATLLAAQGELPRPPHLQGGFTVVDLRNSAGEVATLDNSDAAQMGWSVGRTVTLAELAMQGLRDSSEKTLLSRSLPCPNCGAALQVKLANTQSIACAQCNSVVDISKGAGADLAHYQQNNSGPSGATPQIPLGSTGTLELGGPPLPWQVLGYQERCDNPQRNEEETTYWREYLLYHREAGFAFLVDSNEGWSWVRPITGAPAVRGNSAQWQGVDYEQRWQYAAQVTWVQGEFYWRVQQGELAQVTDFEGRGANAARRLSREATSSEVTWSAGQTLRADDVARAFAIAPASAAALRRDSAPMSSGHGVRNALILFVLVVMVILLVSRCSRDDCDETQRTFGAASTEYRQCVRNQGAGGNSGNYGSGSGGNYGGSYGGYSSGGGGHK